MPPPALANHALTPMNRLGNRNQGMSYTTSASLRCKGLDRPELRIVRTIRSVRAIPSGGRATVARVCGQAEPGP